MADAASPRTKYPKTVSIAESERISPLLIGNQKDAGYFEEPLDLDRHQNSKQFSASLGARRLQGRPSFERNSSRASASDTPLAPILDGYFSNASSSRPQSHHEGHHNLVAQVTGWIKDEKRRRDGRRAARKAKKAVTKHAKDSSPSRETTARRGSESSEGDDSLALSELSAILEKAMLAEKQRQSHSRKKSFSRSRQKSVVASDTESIDNEPHVPHADASLDNSRTLAYSGGHADSTPDLRRASSATAIARDREAWTTFKSEIVRLTHTLRLKGWRRVPRDLSHEIEVTRLSGALTNAVYVVSPPKELPELDDKGENRATASQKRPPKLLLRIYGPQVEHLIDRESELQILRRLARKRIGPRMLGTFNNGRFEEFLHAETLTIRDLSIPETSKQIAKRMRELHEGIELLPKEREDGPFVWRNWDKWEERCEQIVTWLDQQVDSASARDGTKSTRQDGWKARGYVCGTPWEMFKKTLVKYRAWLDDQYGGADKVKQRLVFAHNDTQYGNILRMTPATESPLLLPANVHKQLVVIDFEYANANLPGLEFANHFTEWCYNYHDATAPHAVRTRNYPTPQEQHRFIRAYVQHRPAFASVTSTPPTPLLAATTASAGLVHSSSSISTFMLDSRAPPSPDLARRRGGSKEDLRTLGNRSREDLRLREENAAESDGAARVEAEVQRLMAETRVWRMANSAQWVAWGIVQAKVPGLPALGSKQEKEVPEVSVDEASDDGQTGKKKASDEGGVDAGQVVAGEEDEAEEEEEEFDYLAYAQDRAMFFWGDALALGIVEMEELPEELRGKVKVVQY